jgi:hypothetical protein
MAAQKFLAFVRAMKPRAPTGVKKWLPRRTMALGG